jgi:hypothetical protein
MSPEGITASMTEDVELEVTKDPESSGDPVWLEELRDDLERASHRDAGVAPLPSRGRFLRRLFGSR